MALLNNSVETTLSTLIGGTKEQARESRRKFLVSQDAYIKSGFVIISYQQYLADRARFGGLAMLAGPLDASASQHRRSELGR